MSARIPKRELKDTYKIAIHRQGQLNPEEGVESCLIYERAVEEAVRIPKRELKG